MECEASHQFCPPKMNDELRSPHRFRWVFCQLDRLRRCLPGRIRRALDELPATLDGTYERTLLDIDEENWVYAHRLFQCITVAPRPLRVEELAEFLAFDFDEGENPTFEADWRPDDPEDAVLSTCSSLIAVVNVNNKAVVQFSHFSVKEFLTSNRIARGLVSRYRIPLEPAHLTMARTCFTVLLHLDGHFNEAAIKNLPLVFYASQYWSSHVKFGDVSLQVQDAMRRVFDPTEPYYSAWTWLEFSSESTGWISKITSTPIVPPLHRATMDGFADVVEWLVTSRSQGLEELHSHKTPLYYATCHGNPKIGRLLIKLGADANAPRCIGLRPLHIASSKGRLETLHLLIANGADVNARDDNDWTAISFAAEEGRLEAVRVLLDNGADPNMGRSVKSPLYRALEDEHLEVAQLLLKYGADINSQDGSGRTMLHLASRRAKPKLARLLLEHGANIHARDSQGKTPLQVAIDAEHQDIVELLLQHGAKGS